MFRRKIKFYIQGYQVNFFYRATNTSVHCSDHYAIPLQIGSRIKLARYNQFCVLMRIGENKHGVRGVVGVDLDISFCETMATPFPHPDLISIELPSDFLVPRGTYEHRLFVVDPNLNIEDLSPLQSFFGDKSDRELDLSPEQQYSAVSLPFNSLYCMQFRGSFSQMPYARFHFGKTGKLGYSPDVWEPLKFAEMH